MSTYYAYGLPITAKTLQFDLLRQQDINDLNYKELNNNIKEFIMELELRMSGNRALSETALVVKDGKSFSETPINTEAIKLLDDMISLQESLEQLYSELLNLYSEEATKQLNKWIYETTKEIKGESV